MKIKRATIFGFGKWVDFSIDFTKDSLVCIYGENESGKSTIQKFILFMLFGFPPRKRNFYRPKTSGKMGGRLTVYDSAIGEYTIERFDEVSNGAAKCYTSDGQDYDEDWLKEQLKGMTYETYESIYSFSALDLIDFKNMKDEDLGEVLLGIGLTGSTEIYSIEKSLDNKLGELFKPYGKNPIINQQLNTLDELFASLTFYHNNEATYRNKQTEIAILRDKIAHLKTKLKMEKDACLTIEKHQHALPIIHEYTNLINKLANYPPEINFPASGLERLQSLKEKQLPMRSELSILIENQNATKLRIEQFQKQLLGANFYEQAEEITQEKQHYIENKSKLIKYKETVAKQDFQIKSKLNDMNIGLTIKNLASIKFPFHIEQTWGELRNNMQRLKLEKEQHQLENHSFKKQQEALFNQLEKVKVNLLTDRHIQELHDKNKDYEQNDYVQQLSTNMNDQHKQWEKTKATKKKQMNYMLVGTIPISLLTGGAAYLLQESWLFTISVLSLILGIGQWIWGNRSIKETETILFYEQNDQHPTFTITYEEKQYNDQLLSIDNDNQNELSAINSQLKSIDVELIKWNEKEAALEQQQFRLNEQIKSEQANYPFLQEIDVLFWLELYYTLKHLIKDEHEKNLQEQEYESIAKKQDMFHKKVKNLIQQVMHKFDNKSVEHKLNLIEEILEKHNNAKGLITQYKQTKADNKAKIKEVQQKLQTYDTEISSLFKIAEVINEEAFYIKEKQLKSKQTIEAGINKTIDQLSMNYSKSAREKLVNDQIDQQTLELKQEQSKSEIKEIENRLHKQSEQLAKLNADFMNMESSESHSKTIHQFNMEQEQLKKLVREWAVLKTAKEMLGVTKRNYQNKYLPKVIDKTSHYFKIITNGAYKRVFTPVDGKPFQVERIDDLRYTINELSQGTVDQLYVSLRLAISEIMSDEHRLPFIIDDAFVHFDTVRTKQMMNLLTDIGKRQQVIIFTCKKEVSQSVDKANLIHLEKIQEVV